MRHAFLVAALALVAPGCVTWGTAGAVGHPWTEIEPPERVWVVVDDRGEPVEVVALARVEEHLNENFFRGPGIVGPEGRRGLVRVSYEPPSSDELAVVDFEVLGKPRKRWDEEPPRSEIVFEPPTNGRLVELAEPHTILWNERRYRLAAKQPRALPGAVGFAALLPLAVVADALLTPVYLVFGVLLVTH